MRSDQEERRIVNLWVNTNVEKIMNWNVLFKICFSFIDFMERFFGHGVSSGFKKSLPILIF